MKHLILSVSLGILFCVGQSFAQLNCSGGALNCPGTPTGTGVVVLQTSPTLTTPVLGVATGTSLALTSTFSTSGVGPHAFGGATASDTQLLLTGTFAGINGFKINDSLTLASGDSGKLVRIDGTITEFSSGIHGVENFLTIAGSVTNGGATATDNNGIDVVTWTAPAGTTNASSIRLAAPTGGCASCYAINVLSGTSVLPTINSSTLHDANGNVFLTGSATASAVDSITITNAATATVPVVTIASSGTDSNVTTQISGKGTGLVSWGSIEQAPSNIVRLDNAFTDSNASGLQNITGLSWTMPANIATIWPFHCRLVVNQNTAAVVDTIGIQDVTIAPTYIQATGIAETALTAAAFGDLGTSLTTTTATGIISFTPGAIGTNLTVLIDGVINQPSNASSSVIQMMIQQATAADTIIVQKGSFCSFGGTS